MPNKNYIAGRRKEYKIVNKEKANGNIAFRSAGSHSPVDVVSIDIANKIIYLIQSKPNSMSEKKKFNIANDNKDLNGNYAVIFIVK